MSDTTRHLEAGSKILDYFDKSATVPPSLQTQNLIPNTDDHEPLTKSQKITTAKGRGGAKRPRVPAKKRVKQDSQETKTVNRRHRAKLGLLPSLPLDTLFEVFRHLTPLDLLHLSRTTKDFRNILLHRSATGLWKDVLSNIDGLPSCPADMSLPSWVNLLFDTHCHNCLARNASKCVDFLLRVRFCGKCAKIRLSSETDYDINVELHAIILRAVPFSPCDNDSGTKYCVKSVRDAFLRELDSLDGDDSSFVQDRIARTEKQEQHAALCEEWYETTVQNRIYQLDSIRTSRQKAIREKLSALGYGKELEFADLLDRRGCAIIPPPRCTAFREYNLVKQCKPLTERTWANMKTAMVEYMVELRRLKLKHEQCLVVRQRRISVCELHNAWRRQPENLLKYPVDAIMPGVADVLKSPVARLITNASEVEKVNDGEILLFKSSLSTFVKDFRHDLVFNLWSMTRFVGLRNDFLFRATVVFRCTNTFIHMDYEQRWLVDEGISTPSQSYETSNEVREPCMWYPEFIFHPCCTTINRNWNEQVARENLYLSVHNEFDGCRRDAWDVRERLQFDDKASKTVMNLLDCLGLSEATTVVELDQRDDRFVCLKCSFGNKPDGERIFRIWSWRDAVHHNLKAHFGDTQVKWDSISPEDTAKARELEKQEFTKRDYRTPEKQKTWKCIACRDTSLDGKRMSWNVLRHHFCVFPKHGDAGDMDGKEGTQYYKALGYSTRERPPVKMIPGKASTI